MAKPTFFYDNRLSDATLVASSVASGFAAASVTDWRPYTWYKPNTLPATLTVDCASAKAADYLLVYGHNLYTKGCTVEVRGSTDNFAASDVLVASKTPTSDAPFLVLFNSVAYRYWRLRITGAAAPSLAIVSIGARLVLPTYLPQGFDPRARKVEGQNNTNENGQPLGQVIQFESWKQRIRLERVTWSWLRNTWEPAWNAHLRSKPFGFAWETDLFPEDIKLVKTGLGFDSPHSAGGTCDLSVELSGVVT